MKKLILVSIALLIAACQGSDGKASTGKSKDAKEGKTGAAAKEVPAKAPALKKLDKLGIQAELPSDATVGTAELRKL